MIEIIKVKQKADRSLGRTATSPARNRKDKSMEGSVPHGHNVRVDTRQEWLREDRRIPAEEQEDEIEIPNDEEEMFTRESIKGKSDRFAAEQHRLKERQVGIVLAC